MKKSWGGGSLQGQEDWNLGLVFAVFLLPTVTGAWTEVRGEVKDPCSVRAAVCL